MCLVSSTSSNPENSDNGKRPIFQSQIHETRRCTKNEQSKKDWQRALFQFGSFEKWNSKEMLFPSGTRTVSKENKYGWGFLFSNYLTSFQLQSQQFNLKRCQMKLFNAILHNLLGFKVFLFIMQAQQSLSNLSSEINNQDVPASFYMVRLENPQLV